MRNISKSAQRKLDKLKEQGLITHEQDLYGDEGPSRLFSTLVTNLSGLLDPNSYMGTPKDGIKTIRFLFDKLIRLVGPLLINQKIVNSEYVPDDRPAIYVMNHFFKNDVLSTILALKKALNQNATLFMASLPAIYNSLDGILAYINRCVVTNRKIKETNRGGFNKLVDLIRTGHDVIICAEGVHNKTEAELILDLYNGAILLQEETKDINPPIVPIIHYTEDSLDKRKPIYTSIGKPLEFGDDVNVYYTSYSDLISIALGEKKLSDFKNSGKDKYATSFSTELLRNILSSYYVENMLQYYNDYGPKKKSNKVPIMDPKTGKVTYCDSSADILLKYGIPKGIEGPLNAAFKEWQKDYRHSIPCYDTPIEVSAHRIPKYVFNWQCKQSGGKGILDNNYNIFVPVMSPEDRAYFLSKLQLTEEDVKNGAISENDLYDYYCTECWQYAREVQDFFEKQNEKIARLQYYYKVLGMEIPDKLKELLTNPLDGIFIVPVSDCITEINVSNMSPIHIEPSDQTLLDGLQECTNPPTDRIKLTRKIKSSFESQSRV